MKIVVAGGTGFLGRPLTERLVTKGHQVVVLTREAASQEPARAVVWSPDGSVGAWANEIDGADAVVNLAGESIAARRWSANHKQQILDSRIRATRSLAAAIARASQPPSVFVSGSAVGYYGPLGDEWVVEATPPDRFSGTVCHQWEAEATRAASSRTRVVAYQDRAGARTRRRRASADAAAVQIRRRRSGRFGSPVLALDSPQRLD